MEPAARFFQKIPVNRLARQGFDQFQLDRPKEARANFILKSPFSPR